MNYQCIRNKKLSLKVVLIYILATSWNALKPGSQVVSTSLLREERSWERDVLIVIQYVQRSVILAILITTTKK